MALLAVGDQFPHVELTQRDGGAIPYRQLWQRRALLLVIAPAADAVRYQAQLDSAATELASYEAAYVVTTTAIERFPYPGVVVADRWGELMLVSGELLEVDSLLEWVRFTQMQCPECQGETR